MAGVFISAAERILFCGVFVLAAAAKPLLKFFQLEYGKPQYEICILCALRRHLSQQKIEIQMM